MSERFSKFIRIAAIIAVLSLATATAWAAKAVNVNASLASACPNCLTDVPKTYSLLPDGVDPYSPFTDSRIQSQILTNNSVFTLDTTNTLVDGLVGPGTRTVGMHFYSSVECKPPYTDCIPPDRYPNNILPVCWGGDYDQDQAVNWSIFAPTSFLRMNTSAKYSGMARLNFNVRSAECDRQLNRFRLEWGAVCITHPSANTWIVTSQACTSTIDTGVNWGEAHMEAYGGRKQNTVDYGDWRMPFQLTLTKP